MRTGDRRVAHVLLVGNSTPYFVSHRIGVARALVARGYHVGVALTRAGV